MEKIKNHLVFKSRKHDYAYYHAAGVTSHYVTGLLSIIYIDANKFYLKAIVQ